MGFDPTNAVLAEESTKNTFDPQNASLVEEPKKTAFNPTNAVLLDTPGASEERKAQLEASHKANLQSILVDYAMEGATPVQNEVAKEVRLAQSMPAPEKKPKTIDWAVKTREEMLPIYEEKVRAYTEKMSGHKASNAEKFILSNMQDTLNILKTNSKFPEGSINALHGLNDPDSTKKILQKRELGQTAEHAQAGTMSASEAYFNKRVPQLNIGADEGIVSSMAKTAVNQAIGLADFVASPLGVATLGMGSAAGLPGSAGLAARGTTKAMEGKFAIDMAEGIASAAKDVANTDKTPGERSAAATTAILSGLMLTGLAGHMLSGHEDAVTLDLKKSILPKTTEAEKEIAVSKEHQATQEGGVSTETSSSNQPVESGQEPKEVGRKIVSTAVEHEGKILTSNDPSASHAQIGEELGIGEPEEPNRKFIVQEPDGSQHIIGREEALDVAQKSGQVKEGPLKEEGKLHSEDLQLTPSPKFKGPGAAAAAEFPPKRTVTVKNAAIDEARKKRGWLPVFKAASKSHSETWEAAMDAVEKDPEIGSKIVDALLSGSKTTASARDQALLDYELARIHNERDMAQDRASDPNSTEEERTTARLDAQRHEDRLNLIEQAANKIGTISGRSLQFRQQLIADDYTLAGMERKARASRGRGLTPEESIKIKELQAKIEKLQKQVADKEKTKLEEGEATKDSETDKEINQMKSRAKGKKPAGTPEEQQAKITAAIEKKAKEGNEVGNLIQRLAEHFVGLNLNIDRDSLVKQVHDVVKQFLPDSTPRDIRDAISGYGKYKELSKEEVKVKLRDLKGQMQQTSKLDDMLTKGELPAKTGTERRTPSNEERTLIKEVNRIKKELWLDSDDPNKLKSALATVKTRLTNRIADLKQAIAKGEAIPKRSRTDIDDAEAKSLRAEVEQLQKEYDAAFKEPSLTPEQIALKIYKSRTQNRIAEFQRRITEGDYSKAPRREPMALDKQAQNLKVEAERLKQEFQQGLRKEQLANRTPLEKAQDTFVKWRRAFVLSSPVTLAKLTSAAAERMLFTPIEELIGEGLIRIPGVSEIAERAPREGGLNTRAEAKALTEGFIKGMRDAWDVLKTGQSELNILYGRKNPLPREGVEFIGSIHGALKTVAKRNEFVRSFEKRAADAIANGVDVSDPLVQTRIATAAYRDANKAIFMQDNRVVSAYNRALSALEQPDKLTGKVPVGSKAMAVALRTLLPIVKVPTNVVAETLQYAFGSVTGSVRLANAMRNGVENLRPEQADLIMRELKKGSLGAAVMLLGFLNPQAVGGYYQPGEKRGPEDAKVASLKVFGMNVPSYLIHNPLLETLQIGATIRRVSESKLKKSDADTQGLSAGVWAGALGLTSEVPFLSEMGDITKAYNPRERGAFAGELAKSLAIPQGVQWLAGQTDKDAEGNTTKRAPETILQHVETGIPGLRKNVPEKRSKVKQPSWLKGFGKI